MNVKIDNVQIPQLFIHFKNTLNFEEVKKDEKFQSLKKSLLKLAPDNDYENVIKIHFQNCLDYGFTVVTI